MINFLIYGTSTVEKIFIFLALGVMFGWFVNSGNGGSKNKSSGSKNSDTPPEPPTGEK